MTIEGNIVEVLLDGVRRTSIGATAPEADWRNREHTNIFIAEIGRRYAPGVVPENLITASVAVIDAAAGGRITTAVVRQAITGREAALGLPSTAALVPGGPAPVTALDRFLALLEMRRGAYTWVSTMGGAVSQWVSGPNPLAAPLSLDTAMNCWEAMLVTAVDAGLITAATVAAMYANQRSVETVLAHNGVAGTIHHTEQIPGANAIQRGQIIVTYLPKKQLGTPLSHVVAVSAVNAADYRAIEVYSLWTHHNGGILRRLPLHDLLGGREHQLDYMTL
ncbi:hypothetical protein [Pseudofrankia saprophytica]|uniref:hypothetical protein n=1 Tax=Pseudofrankia saprophytica TaxID=298655 RepID=UPI000234C7E4|nr:hypothetical protein [Pseudofrankia saprophytica]